MLFYINDLPSCVNSKVRLFADDCLLYRVTKNNQDQIGMQRDLDVLMDWGSTWSMKFNAKRCNIIRVSRSRKPLQNFYSLDNEILQEVCVSRSQIAVACSKSSDMCANRMENLKIYILSRASKCR